MGEFETTHACGHTSRIHAKLDSDDRRFLTMRAESCAVCRAENWLSAYSKIAPPLIGDDADLVEAADFQRILTIKDVERRQEEVRATVILLLYLGKGNVDVLQEIFLGIQAIYDAVMQNAVKRLEAEWWIENGSAISAQVNSIDLNELLEEYE